MDKTKNVWKLVAISIPALILLSGIGGVSACYEESPLYAGQDIDNPIGNVEVWHYGETLRVKYVVEGGWTIEETNLAVAESFEEIPQNKKGNPKIGQFPYSDDHGTVVWYSYYIDLSEDFPDLYNPVTGQYEGTLYIAAHAVVTSPEGISETAWADTGYEFPGGSWALYFIVTL
jgi:hypothetical protein